MSGYRENAPTSPDVDAIAASELGRRARRLRGFSIVSCVLVGLGVGVVGYVLLREVQLELVGAHVPYVTGFITVGPALAGSLRSSLSIARALIRWRSPGWVSEIAKRHQVSPESIEEFTRVL